MLQYLYLLATIIAISTCIWVFLMPLNLKYDNTSSKKSAINKAKRTRKIGEKIPPPFPNGWFAVASSSDVKRGEAKNFDCLGENFVIFRSSSDKVFVLDAYCPHMGANLGVGGIVKDNCIECPFHQWKFNGLDGSLVDVPYSENFNELEKVAKLRTWTSKEVNGLIFVWYHAENEEPWDLPMMDLTNKMLHGSNEFIINSHIQDIPENGADNAHLATVHGPSVMSGDDIRFTRNSSLSLGTHIWDAKWFVDENYRHVAIVKLTHILKLLNLKCMSVESTIKQIGPGYVVLELYTFFGNVTILQTLTPLEPLVQRLSHFFYASPLLGWYMKFVIWAETVQVARDMMIWDSKQFKKNPLLAREEKQIRLYRNWFGQFYSENSKTFSAAYNSNNNLEW